MKCCWNCLTGCQRCGMKMTVWNRETGGWKGLILRGSWSLWSRANTTIPTWNTLSLRFDAERGFATLRFRWQRVAWMRRLRIRICGNFRKHCMSAAWRSWKNMLPIAYLMYPPTRKSMMSGWSCLIICRMRWKRVKKNIWMICWIILTAICRVRLPCWLEKGYRISVISPDHTVMPACFVPFRDFEAKRISISMRKKYRCPMTVWFYARRVWIICWKWWNRIIIWKSVLL